MKKEASHMTIEELGENLKSIIEKIDNLEKKVEELDKKILNKRKILEKENLNQECELAKFKVSSGKKFACAAAQAIINEPGNSYNPLYLYGETGVGKTYLMQAMGNEILKRNSNYHVVYITAKQFKNQLLEEKDKQDFINQYASIDILLIDDVQYLEGKEEVQEALLKIIEILLENKKQIVIASNKSTWNMENISEGLKEKFEWGLIADMK